MYDPRISVLCYGDFVRMNRSLGRKGKKSRLDVAHHESGRCLTHGYWMSRINKRKAIAKFFIDRSC